MAVPAFYAAAMTCGYMLLEQSLEWLCPLSCCCYDMRLHTSRAEPEMAVPAFMMLGEKCGYLLLGQGLE